MMINLTNKLAIQILLKEAEQAKLKARSFDSRQKS